MAARNEVILTTADTVAGRETVEEIDIVAAECVFGMNMFRDLFASIRDVFGGRSQSYQRVFRDARDTVKTELKEQAEALGAHAVVATRCGSTAWITTTAPATASAATWASTRARSGSRRPPTPSPCSRG
jgi:uncharacterized protein YbjQ (UPF0145 family)